MLAKEYRLKSARSSEFLIGYARHVEVDSTVIRLRGRYIPLPQIERGRLILVPQPLPDIEFPASKWAIWTFPVEAAWLEEPILI